MMETIKKITIKKNKYHIQTDQHSYAVDEFYYQILLPYVGKELDRETILELSCFTKAADLLIRLYPKIFHGAYSKKQLYFKLKEKNLEAEEIRLIMNKLKSENYLRDELFIAYHQEIFEQKKGVRAFANFLKENQIREDKIQAALDTYSENVAYALAYANSLIRRKTASSALIKRQIEATLMQKGYSQDTIRQVLSKINPIPESENINKDYHKYKKMYDNPYKILSKMLQKGYNKEEVLKVMECEQDEN